MWSPEVAPSGGSGGRRTRLYRGSKGAQEPRARGEAGGSGSPGGSGGFGGCKEAARRPAKWPPQELLCAGEPTGRQDGLRDQSQLRPEAAGPPRGSPGHFTDGETESWGRGLGRTRAHPWETWGLPFRPRRGQPTRPLFPSWGPWRCSLIAPGLGGSPACQQPTVAVHPSLPGPPRLPRRLQPLLAGRCVWRLNALGAREPGAQVGTRDVESRRAGPDPPSCVLILGPPSRGCYITVPLLTAATCCFVPNLLRGGRFIRHGPCRHLSGPPRRG